MVTRNDAPKLPVEPTVVAPPSMKLPNTNMPTIGDPMAKLAGPPSNGIGAGAGIGAVRAAVSVAARAQALDRAAAADSAAASTKWAAAFRRPDC